MAFRAVKLDVVEYVIQRTSEPMNCIERRPPRFSFRDPRREFCGENLLLLGRQDISLVIFCCVNRPCPHVCRFPHAH